MSSQFSFRKIFLGVAAGLLSALACLILAYIAGIASTAISTKDFFTTLLVGVTYLPLMLFFVLFLPSLGIALVIGLTLGLISNSTNRAIGLVAGAIDGVVLGEIVLSFVVPLIVVPQPGDFTSIVSNHYLSGVYGLVLGVLTGLFFRWMNAS
jgi:hypothetical protein